MIGGEYSMQSCTDGKLAQLDMDYMAKQQLEPLFSGVMLDLLEEQPCDPLQYIIDWVQLGKQAAKQDVGTGLPQHRLDKLLKVFDCIDKEGSGHVSLKAMQQFSNKYGGQMLTFEELQLIFRDFKPSADNLISKEHFLVFFSKVSRTITNADFEDLVAEMCR